MKRIIFIIIVLLLFFSILRLSMSIYTLWHKQDVLTAAEQELTQEKRENMKLHQQLVTVKSPQFLEKEARDKLLLVKPGEEDILIDQTLLRASASASKKSIQEPFWQQWIDVFF